MSIDKHDQPIKTGDPAVVSSDLLSHRMKPVIILPKKEMSRADISRQNANGFVVVEATDPSKVRFCEPPPIGYSSQEKAAIGLCRFIMRHTPSSSWTRRDLAETLANIFMEGSPLETIKKA